MPLFQARVSVSAEQLLPVMLKAVPRKKEAEEMLEEMFIFTGGLVSVNLGSEFDNIEIYEIKHKSSFGDVLVYMNL